MTNPYRTYQEPVLVWTGQSMLDARLSVPSHAAAVVVIAAPAGTWDGEAYRRLARRLEESRFATLLVNLLDADEQQADTRTAHFRRDIQLLSERLKCVITWVQGHDATRGLTPVFYGSGATAAAAMIIEDRPLAALVCNSPRIDLIDNRPVPAAPVLMLLSDSDLRWKSGRDAALAPIPEKRLEIVPDAARLLEDEEAVELVASRATAWFRDHLPVAADAYGIV